MSLDTGPKQRTSPGELAVAPPPQMWDDWIELDPAAWLERVEKRNALIPTICFLLRKLQAWGVDGHDSHTNVCSALARLG